MESRRKFIEKVAASSAALTIGSVASGMSAKSYGKIIGANDRIRVAMIGVNNPRVGHDLNIDPKNGHIIKDPDAQKLWSRSYEKGWEPKV